MTFVVFAPENDTVRCIKTHYSTESFPQEAFEALLFRALRRVPSLDA